MLDARDIRARNSSLAGCLQLSIDASVSVPFCKRGISALYALVNSNRSAPFAVSSAWKRNPETFVLSRIRNRGTAGYPARVYLLTAWMVPSANFASTEFSEVRLYGVLRSSRMAHRHPTHGGGLACYPNPPNDDYSLDAGSTKKVPGYCLDDFG